MIRAFLLSILVPVAGVGLSACGQPCDDSHICALDTDNQLCDGDSYVACSGGNRNQRVTCQKTPKVAVCSPSGWTFENVSQ
jgi:hypothetical protein